MRQFNACERKRFFKSEYKVNLFIKKLPKKDDTMNSYKCKYCVGWHIGHLKSQKYYRFLNLFNRKTK